LIVSCLADAGSLTRNLKKQIPLYPAGSNRSSLHKPGMERTVPKGLAKAGSVDDRGNNNWFPFTKQP